MPGTPTLAPAGLAALKAGTGPVPPSVASLASGASTTFTWTFVAGATPGNIRISSGATGADANSGVALSSGDRHLGRHHHRGRGHRGDAGGGAGDGANAGQGITLTLDREEPGARGGERVHGRRRPSSTSTDGRPAPASPADPRRLRRSVLAAGQIAHARLDDRPPRLSAPASTGNLSLAGSAGRHRCLLGNAHLGRARPRAGDGRDRSRRDGDGLSFDVGSRR